MTAWCCEKSVISGWHVIWPDGDTEYSFQPNQHGKVKSVGYSPAGAFAPCAFGVIQERVTELLPQLKQHRFGTRFSAERGVLCGRISSHLNGIGFKPLSDTHRPEGER
ncbi:MAG: hypothetical protein WC670_18300 [Pseudolabrys sp.]|jgi:hypothetical protein